MFTGALTDDPTVLGDLDMACTVRHFAEACTSLGKKYRGFDFDPGYTPGSQQPEGRDPNLAKPKLAAYYLDLGCSTEVEEYSLPWPAVVRESSGFTTEHITNNPARSCASLIALYEDDKALPPPSGDVLDALHDRRDALTADAREVGHAREAPPTKPRTCVPKPISPTSEPKTPLRTKRSWIRCKLPARFSSQPR